MADFAEYLPYDAVLYGGNKASEVHNLFPQLWAQVNRQAINMNVCGDRLGLLADLFGKFTGHISTSLILAINKSGMLDVICIITIFIGWQTCHTSGLTWSCAIPSIGGHSKSVVCSFVLAWWPTCHLGCIRWIANSKYITCKRIGCRVFIGNCLNICLGNKWFNRHFFRYFIVLNRSSAGCNILATTSPTADIPIIVLQALIGSLSSAMSGMALTHSDIGGYTMVEEFGLKYLRTKELLIRWLVRQMLAQLCTGKKENKSTVHNNHNSTHT